ncbi:MAG: hypothetical protein PHR35_08565 [Kiritimatiellae bacterium]|nr:hypothetical protein [Kiritimatiellia bacterium]
MKRPQHGCRDLPPCRRGCPGCDGRRYQCAEYRGAVSSWVWWVGVLVLVAACWLCVWWVGRARDVVAVSLQDYERRLRRDEWPDELSDLEEWEPVGAEVGP